MVGSSYHAAYSVQGIQGLNENHNSMLHRASFANMGCPVTMDFALSLLSVEFYTISLFRYQNSSAELI